MEEAGKEKLGFDFKKIGIVGGAIVIVLIVAFVLSSGIKEFKKKQPATSSGSETESLIQENTGTESTATEEGKVDIEFESLKEEDSGGGDDMDQNQVDKLVTEDTLVGNGTEAKIGDTVSVHYTGTLTDGKKFDSSLDRGDPFSFTIGEGRVIQGWEQGVPGMKVGGKRKLTIPSDLGYGDRGSPPIIPPNATLIFEIELLGIE